MMIRIYKAESLVSLLVAMMLFALLAMSFLAWQQSQLEQGIANYQQQQALQLAENQLALRMAKLGCESQAVINGVKFTIQCQTEQIKVSYPLGQVEIKSE